MPLREHRQHQAGDVAGTANHQNPHAAILARRRGSVSSHVDSHGFPARPGCSSVLDSSQTVADAEPIRKLPAQPLDNERRW